MWAIIGGSGFERFEEVEVLETYDGDTPFGKTSSGLKRVRVGEHECFFLSRHGQFHEMLPSEVNYQANIYALKDILLIFLSYIINIIYIIYNIINI